MKPKHINNNQSDKHLIERSIKSRSNPQHRWRNGAVKSGKVVSSNLGKNDTEHYTKVKMNQNRNSHTEYYSYQRRSY